jgi:hypothetical protein
MYQPASGRPACPPGRYFREPVRTGDTKVTFDIRYAFENFQTYIRVKNIRRVTEKHIFYILQ